MSPGFRVGTRDCWTQAWKHGGGPSKTQGAVSPSERGEEGQGAPVAVALLSGFVTRVAALRIERAICLASQLRAVRGDALNTRIETRLDEVGKCTCFVLYLKHRDIDCRMGW